MGHSNQTERLEKDFQQAEEGKRFSKLVLDCARQKLEKSKPKEIETITYSGHLSENHAFSEQISSRIRNRKKGLLMAIYSPCGSGKTAFCLTSLAEKLPDSTSILTVPNKIQTVQNEKYTAFMDGNEVHAIPISAESRQNFRLKRGTTYTFVYDSASELVSILTDPKTDKDICRDIVLEIDEAHMLIDAEHFRRKAVPALKKAMELVLGCGGTVIILTGTPNKLLGLPVDVEYRCIQVRDRKEVPFFNFRKLDLVRKSNKNVNFKDFMVYLIEECIEDGGIPIARYNDKIVLDLVGAVLRKKGYIVRIISAETKGFRLVRDPETGKIRRVYDDLAYEKLQEESSLPYADAYLCTSVIEVGTSIEYVEDAEGNKQQPENFVPIYCCNRPEEFNQDSIMQFLSRNRFPIDRAVIAMNTTTKSRGKHTSLKSYGECVLELVDENIMKIGAGKGCFDTPGVGNDSAEDTLLSYNAAGIVDDIDTFHLFAEGWARYGRQGYTHPEWAKDIIQGVFPEAEITVRIVKNIPKEKTSGNLHISDKTKTEIYALCGNPESMKAVMRRSGFDRTNPELNRFAANPSGKKALIAMKKYGQSGAFKGDDLARIVISELTDPGKPVILSDGGIVADPDLAAEHYALLKISGMASSKQQDLVDYMIDLASHEDEQGIQNTNCVSMKPWELFSSEEMNWIDYVIGSSSFESVVRALKVFRQFYTVADYSEFFRALAKSEQKDYPDWLNRAMRIVNHNKVFGCKLADRDSYDPGRLESSYSRNVYYRQSRIDAEYHALIRNERVSSLISNKINNKAGTGTRAGSNKSPLSSGSSGSPRNKSSISCRFGEFINDGLDVRGWYYPNKKSGLASGDSKEAFGIWHYPYGFIGHSVTPYDMEQIAGLMPGVVTKLCHTKVHLKYTWKDICSLLRIIFSTRRIEGSSGEEDDFYLQIVGLRRQFPKSCAWASMTEEQAITKVEEIVTQNVVPASNDSAGWAKLIRQIEAILRQYTFLGEHSESMGTLQNIIGWLPFCMDPPTPDGQERVLYCHYQKGQLQLLIDLEKQRIGYNEKHSDSPDLIPVGVKDLELAQAYGPITDWGRFKATRAAARKKAA